MIQGLPQMTALRRHLQKERKEGAQHGEPLFTTCAKYTRNDRAGKTIISRTFRVVFHGAAEGQLVCLQNALCLRITCRGILRNIKSEAHSTPR